MDAPPEFTAKAHRISSRRLDHPGNGAHHPLELRQFNAQLFFSIGREGVVARARLPAVTPHSAFTQPLISMRCNAG